MPYADPEKKRQKQAEYRARTKERRAAYHKEYTAKNLDRVRARKRQWQRERRGIVGATDEARQGACEVCGRAAALVCDHDHSTGLVRGWLCTRCNVLLAALDDREWFEKAEAYRVKDR